MAIKKIALMENILPQVVPASSITDNEEATVRFKEVIAKLRESQTKEGKKIAPKVDDFLYASCIMMHAAEASLIDQNTGEPLLNKKGESVTGGFVECTDHKGQKSIKWSSPDGIQAYRNGNGDIFPEEDLLKAYKEWVGKPLCKDHVSDSVDGVRGVIVDTYYDPKFKRVHALFALDRVNYKELARKVEAGYATSVSMGTAVGKSICTECGNVATVESEYCSHVRNKSCYGEINQELTPIELSIVVTGADPQAKIKTVLAHLKTYEEQVSKLANSGKVSKDDAHKFISDIHKIQSEVSEIKTADSKDINEKAAVLLRLLGNVDSADNSFDEARDLVRSFVSNYSKDLSRLSNSNLEKMVGVLNHLELSEEKQVLLPLLFKRTKEMIMDDGADVQVGAAESTPTLVDSQGESLRSDEDLQNMREPAGIPGDMVMGDHVPQHFASLYVAQDDKAINDSEFNQINNKIAALAEQLKNIKDDLNKETSMTFSDLKKKALERKSYFQGTEDPSEALPYDRMGDDHDIRENKDKQMVGDELDTSADNPDMEQKKMLQRAELEARMARRAENIRKIQAKMMEIKDKQTGQSKVVEKQPDGSLKEYESAAEDGKNGKKSDKKAYMLGTEDPNQALPYELMGDQESARLNDDKHMHQTGELAGPGGMVPGDEDLKKGLHRIANKKLSAKFYKASSNDKSRWEIFAGVGDSKSKVFVVEAGKAYGEKLNEKTPTGNTFSDFFHSKTYGERVMKLVRAEGPEGAMAEMGLDEEALPEVELQNTEGLEGEMESALDNDQDELSKLREALFSGVEKIEVGLEEIRSAVVEEPASEGLNDLDVEMEGADTGMPMPDEGLPAPVASVTDKDMFEAFAFLSDLSSELSYMGSELEGKDNEFVSLAKDALADADVAVEKVADLLSNYKLSKKANILGNHMMAKDHKSEDDCDDDMKVVKVIKVKEHGDDANDYNREMMEMYALTEDEKEEVEEIAEEVAEEVAEDEKEEHEEEMHADDKDHEDKDDGKEHEEEMKKLDELEEELDKLHESVEDLDEDHEELKEKLSARKEWRKQVLAAAENLDELYLKHRGEGGPDLDVPGDAKVETLHETHEAMKDVATKDAAGPQVREAAEKLNRAIKEGAIDPTKLDQLAAMGAVDSDAVNYYKSYFGQVAEGDEFASELVKEFDKTASQDESEAKIVRYKRAYMLGMKAQEKGLVAKSAAALNEYVDNLVNVPDNVFNSIKNIVESTQARRSSVAVPQVGLNNDENQQGLVSTASADDTTPSFENLARAFLVNK